MRVGMIPVPEARARGGAGVAYQIGDELDGGGGVGDEDEVEVRGVGVEEAKCLRADRGDLAGG